ncbi:hypothetical protein DRJ58_01025 [Candidatus Acetothermia bacterium]|nr:MAG: hypothetical protein DRJ58_01025 [Candidatus Acetothermia bacterium]
MHLRIPFLYRNLKMEGVMEVGRIRKGELPSVVEIWKESFRGELAQRGADLGNIAPLFRAFLSLRRLPLWVLHRLGVPVEVWVLRMGGRPVGAVGQIGCRVPYIIGLVVKREGRELRLVRLLEQGVATGLRAAGFPLMRALVPAEHLIAKLAIKLGWEAIGSITQFVLPLQGLSSDARSRLPSVRSISFRRERLLACGFTRRRDIKGLLALDRNYGSPVVGILGFRERVFGVEEKGELLGLVRVSWNAYQPVAFMHVPYLREAEAYWSLLAHATRFFRGLGKAELHLDLWEEEGGLREGLRKMGAREAGRWIYLVKRLGPPFL